MMLSLPQLAVALGGEVSGNQVLAPGPGHSPKDRSMSVKLGTDDYIVHSFAGDDWKLCRDHIDERVGAPKWNPQAAPKSDPIANMRRRAAKAERAYNLEETFDMKPKVEKLREGQEEYIYHLADGSPYLRVLRIPTEDGKTFRPFHLDDRGEWVLGAPKGPKVPYRLPELLKYNGATVLLVEGEKDADRLTALGHLATTSSGGAQGWCDDLNAHFTDRDVIIVPDNDEPGEGYAHSVFEGIKRVAASIKVLRLPGLAHKQDVSDWFDAGNTNDEFIDLARSAPEFQPKQDKQKSAKLPWFDISSLDHRPIPERQWAIRDRVPLKQAGLFSGEGGTGKSIIELMKNVAHVAGKDWLGSMPEPGPAFYLGAEDDKDEIHIRLAAIAKHYGVTFKDLSDGGLHVLPLLGEDATLCAVTRGGSIEVTGLYKQLLEAAGDIKPKNISIDTLSRAFAGNEIDRVQVYAFAMHMQALAKAAEGSVTVLSHPSLQGINSGTGLSGSTAWHGAFRFRQYLKGAKGDGEQPDNDLRELEFKKNQYGPRGDSLILRYQAGLFLPEAGVSSLDKASRLVKAEELFMDLLRRFTGESRNVSDKATSPTYAPTAFAKEEEAKKFRIKKPDFEQAMRDLFRTARIRVEEYGRPSRPYSRLVVEGVER
ncbi:AAA family ATPase [Bradyrhizobium sp. JR18.2]|uniref:AAA family ATPase n=1 Tax=Bradyrhizobium sp. JR18.2 TaxID=3156369 RepID=UPI00339466BD